MAITKLSQLTLLLPLLLVLLYLWNPAGAAEPAVASKFVKTACGATTYPALCVQSLASYSASIQQSPRQLAQTALSVSLDRAQFTKTFVTRLTKFKGLKPRQFGAIKDCMDEISDTTDQLSKSVRELKSMGQANGPEFTWHMSNVETWISAALTDENTCMDGFSGRAMDGRIKVSIKARFTHVAQVTSNALALVNYFAAKH